MVAEEKIDVLLATFNGEHYLSKQLDSILRQQGVSCRLIVRDDGSDDETLSILKSYASRYPDQIVLVNENSEKLGAKGNFSFLVGHSTAQYVAFADQDDVWSEDKLKTLIDKMHECETRYGFDTPLIIHSDLAVVDENENLIASSFYDYQGINPYRTGLNSLLVENNVTGCAMLVNRSLLHLANPVPETAVMHDHWLALVASAFGHIEYINIPLLKYRQHEYNVLGASESSLPTAVSKVFKLFNSDAWRLDQGYLIEQAVAFLGVYKDTLSISTKRLLGRFIDSAQAGWWMKRQVFFFYRLLPSSWIRKVSWMLRL